MISRMEESEGKYKNMPHRPIHELPDAWEEEAINGNSSLTDERNVFEDDNTVGTLGPVYANGEHGSNQAGEDEEMDVGNDVIDDDDEQEMYNCDTCGSVFADLSTFMDHRNTDCSAVIITDQHMDSEDSPMSVEGGAYQCQFCNKTFCRLSYLKRHEQIHSDKMPFRCDYCSRLFKHKRSRDRHIKLHTGDKKYQCSECNTCFARSDHLKIHIRTHGTNKQFQCTICNRVLDTLATLTSHYQTCHKYALSVGVQDIVYQETKAQKLWKCGDCNEAFPSAIEKEKHVKDEHTKVSASVLDEGTNHEGELEFKCPICPEMLFENEQALLKHQKSEHQSGYMHVYSCLHCGNEYHSLYNLREHLSSMHPDGSTTIATDVENLSHNTCIFCRITFVSSDALQAHMSSSHPSQENIQSWHPGSRFMCSQCRVSFPSDRSLKEHISQSHGTDSSSTKEQNTFDCPHCTKSYQSEEVLRTHINRTHTESLNKMRYPCPYCIKQNLFDSIEQLQLHIEVYHKSNRPSMHLCPETDCKLYFNTQDDLTNHLKNDHNLVAAGEVASTLDGANQEAASSEDAANESYYSCPSCRNEFKSESQLMVHAVNHFKVVTSEYVCRDCGKSFKKPDELQKHLFEIHAHHLYKCALCKEVFDSKVTIQVHFAVKHSNECRLYSCSQCGVVYRLEEDLFMHVRMQHVKVGQRCNVCGLIFTSTLQLQSHLSTHNLIYRCPYCNATYNEAPSLDVHMKSMHKNVLSPTVPLYGISSKSPHEPVQPPVIKSVNTTCLDSPRQLKKSPHQSSDDGEEGCFICQICDEKFPLKTLLERHHAKEHDIKSRRLTPDVQTPISSPGTSCSYYDNGQGLHVKSNANNTMLKALKSTSQTSGIVCMFCRNAILGENDLVYHSKKHKQYIAGEEASYYCAVCMLHLTSIRNLRIHAHFHFQTSSSDDSKPQNCVMCGENFRPTNNDESPVCLKCISLDTQYPNQISGPAGGGTTTKPGKFRCCHCNVKFESEAELSQHASVHEEAKKKTYQCIKCQKTFASEGEIHAHVTSHMLAEGIYHECKLCKEVFDSPAKLQCHLIDHTFTDKNYECPKCDGKFIFAMDIQAHAIEHGIDGRDHKCDLCSQTFFFSAELMNHVASYHHFENGRLREEYRCYECGRQFISRSNLYSHMKTHTAKERVCRCPLCPEVFLNTLAMQQHYFQSHTEAELVRSKKSLKCPKCDKTFSCATTLQNHMRQHNQSKGYSCTECNKTFGLVKHLTLHMAIHSGQTPFQCPLCDKRFTKREHRKAHFKSHCGMTQFACPHCTKTFSKKSQVQKHMLSHVTKSTKPTSTPRYKCYVCRAAFNDEPTYKQHMQRMHGVQYNQPQDDHTKDISESTTRKNSTTQMQRGTYTGVPENCCPMCNAMFPDDMALRGHMQSFHRIQFSHTDDISSGADNGTSGIVKAESEASYIQPTRMSYQDSIQDPSSRANIVSDCQDQNDVDKGRLSDDNKGYRIYSMGMSDEKLVCPLCEDRFSTTQSMRRHLKRTHGARTSKRRKLSGKGFDENGSPTKTSRRDSSDASSDGDIVVHMAE